MNKKILSLILVLVFVSGCTLKESKIEQNPSTKNMKQDELLEKKSSEGTKQLVNPNQFEDLISQYTQAVLNTNFGDIKVKFYNQDSPFTVNNFLNLAKLGFYNNTKFHRVIKGFMVQGGDPNTKDDDWSNDGIGGPGYTFQDEINQHKLVKGSLAMANSGPDTNGSQFFIVTAQEVSWLDGKHTNFGYIIDGIEVVNEIENVKIGERDHPLQDVIIQNIELIK